jgi:hypothetical protein
MQLRERAIASQHPIPGACFATFGPFGPSPFLMGSNSAEQSSFSTFEDTLLGGARSRALELSLSLPSYKKVAKQQKKLRFFSAEGCPKVPLGCAATQFCFLFPPGCEAIQQ